MIGDTLSHYTILEKIGEGGMGIVYKARDTRLDRIVAIKMVGNRTALGAADDERFQREAKAAASLNHNNICTVYEIGNIDDQPFIAMEFVDGHTLTEMTAERPLRISTVLDYGLQLADGLSAAHEKGIVHRDIKGDNVIVNEVGVVKIMDFGLATIGVGPRLTQEGSTVGTIGHMSPEQARGDSVDHRSDIWSFGVVLYQLITGQLPFRGEYEQAVTYSVLNEDPEPLTAVRTGVPMSLERIVFKALAKEPDDRYQSLRDAIVDLRNVQKLLEHPQDDSSSQSRARTAAVSPGTPAKRNVRPRTIVFIGVAILAVALLIAWFVALPVSRNSYGDLSNSDTILLAVLPFDNLSPNSDDTYFADGMTEEIISKLSRIKRFRVIGRTSVMAYKSTTKSASEIGRELGVKHLLDGSIRKAGNLLRISIQLVDTESQEQMWSGVFDRQLTDVFAIQDSISLAVAEHLEVELLGSELEAVAAHGTTDLTAFDYYLQGRYHWTKRTPEGIRSSIDLYRKAVEADSAYALAYAGLADAFAIQGFWSFRAPSEVYPVAKDAIQLALEHDPDLVEAITSLAFINMVYDWDWGAAESGFQKAIGLNPSYALAHQWYSEFLALRGDMAGALEEIDVALELDPLSPIAASVKGEWYRYVGDFDRAFDQYETVLELNESFGITYLHRAFAYANLEQYELVLTEARRASELMGSHAYALGSMAWAHAKLGRRDEALQILEDLNERSKDRYIPAMSLVGTYQALGEYESAWESLRTAIRDRDGTVLFAYRSGDLEEFEDDPRFVEVRESLGLE